jgi:hypothetical protein
VPQPTGSLGNAAADPRGASGAWHAGDHAPVEGPAGDSESGSGSDLRRARLRAASACHKLAMPSAGDPGVLNLGTWITDNPPKGIAGVKSRRVTSLRVS